MMLVEKNQDENQEVELYIYTKTENNKETYCVKLY